MNGGRFIEPQAAEESMIKSIATTSTTLVTPKATAKLELTLYKPTLEHINVQLCFSLGV
jgi:hypothetical protein